MTKPILIISILIFCFFGVISNAQDIALELPSGSFIGNPKSLKELHSEMKSYNRYLGGYPPRFKSEDQKQKIYHLWSNTLLQVKKYQESHGDKEVILWLLSDLYNQGHNMGVKKAGDNAHTTLQKCLQLYPASPRCNWTASYFYLQIDPKFAPYGEKALLKLREIMKTDRNLQVESGLVYAYMNQKKFKQALSQLDHFLTLKPNDEWAIHTKKAIQSGKISGKITE